MKKILMIFIFGIMILGVVSAVTLSVDSDFKEKVVTLSSSLFYDKLISLDKLSVKEIPKSTDLDLSNSGLEITKNKEGVIKVYAK